MNIFIISFSILIYNLFTEAYQIPFKKYNLHQKQKFKQLTKLNANMNVNLLPELLSIAADDKWGLWATAAAASATGIQLEKNTKIGKALSAPVCSMLITAIATNIGILPTGGSIYLIALQSFVVKLATPLLLLGADLKKIIKETGIILKAFLLGTIGTLLGVITGYKIFSKPINALPDGIGAISALCAKNIGGGLNFMAVADSWISPTGGTGIAASTLGLALACDNVLGLLYFPLISAIGAPYEGDSSSDSSSSSSSNNNNINNNNNKNNMNSKSIDSDITTTIITTTTTTTSSMGNDDNMNNIQSDLEHSLIAIALAFVIASLSEHLAALPLVRHHVTWLTAVPISTALAVIIATCFSKQLQPLLQVSDLIGRILLLLFFGSIGNSAGTISSVVNTTGATAFLMFGCILYIVHLTFILCGGRLLKIPIPDLLLASNANIGNPATASSLAVGMKWNSRALPALLVGTLGNSIGTFLGLLCGRMLLNQ